MARAFILLLDSFGIGATADADKFGDTNANTLLHIIEHCQQGLANKKDLREGPLQIPHLAKLGLIHALQNSHGKSLSFLPSDNALQGAYGFAAEKSSGKDTPSGHWEIAGVPVLFEWGYFPPTYPSFPDSLVNDVIRLGNLPGVLGNKHASGTEIITELGEEHVKTGKPIVYTSADSVFQIAAHETAFGLQRLYDLCQIVRKLVDPYHIGRVIARPFLGEPGNFYRTGNRRDIATPPPSPTLLDNLVEARKTVIAIGKVADIYAHRGISKSIKANGNQEIFDKLIDCVSQAPDESLTFANFVDFDMLYGHRRDVAGYAAALEKLDAQLPHIHSRLQKDDLVIITADHGCDPTTAGSDHTREHIPVLAFGPAIKSVNIGKRETFSDIGQTIAEHLGIAPLTNGTSFLTLVRS